MRVKIFGERNTATNAVAKMIESNSRSFVSPGTVAGLNMRALSLSKNLRRVRIPRSISEGVIDNAFHDVDADRQWKHAATYFDNVRSLSWHHVVFTVRHPLSWLLSFHRNPYHSLTRRSDDIVEFWRSPWRTLARDRLSRIAVPPLKLLEKKMESYFVLAEMLDLAGISYSFIRHEDMVLRQSQVYEQLAPYLDNPNDIFSELAKSTKPKGNVEFYKKYYGNERWRDELPLEILDNFEFSADMLNIFGYESARFER